MKNNRKIFSIKEAVAGAHAVDLQINLFSNDFVENELMVYKDPFRVALVSIKQGGSKYNGYSFRADVLHYCGLQMESEQLHFDFILNHENEIQLFTPAIYFNEIQSLFSSHENQILEKYKAHHCSLFPELNQVLGDSKQDWIMYFSLLAVAHGARDKNEVKALFELTNSNFEKKLSQELITKIIDLKECFHPYVLFNGLRLPSVNYFNERLYFLVRNFCSGDAQIGRAHV